MRQLGMLASLQRHTYEALVHIMMKFDANAARIAARTCISLGIALAIALYLNLPVTPAIITVQMLQSAQLGITVNKSISRFGGAVLAGLIAFLIFGLFPQDRFMIILMFSLCITLVVYQFQRSDNPYLWVITSAIIAVIGLAVAGNPLYIWTQAVHITSSFFLGGAVVILVNSFLWPIPARAAFEKSLGGSLLLLGKQFQLRREELFNDGVNNQAEQKKIRGQALKSVTMMPSLLNYTVSESIQVRRFRDNYKTLINDISVLGGGIISFADMLGACFNSKTLSQHLINSNAVTGAIDQIAEQLDSLAKQVNEARDGSFAVAPFELEIDSSNFDLTQFSHSDRALFEALCAEAKLVISAIQALRVRLANVENPQALKQAPLVPVKKEPFSFTKFLQSERLRWSVIVGLVTFCGTYLWVLTQWPQGFRIALFVPVMGCVLSHSMPGLRLGILVGVAVSVIFSWVFYLLVMPLLPNHFLFLWLALSLFLFPIVYLQALKIPFYVVAGLFGGMAFLMATSITNLQEFSFSSYMDILFGMIGGIVFGIAALSLFIWTRTEVDFRRSLLSFFRLCKSTLQDFESIDKMPNALGRLRTRRKALIAAYEKCVSLANRLPYDDVPQNDREKVDALLQSIWTIAARLDSLLRERVILASQGRLDVSSGANVRAVQGEVFDALQHALEQVDAKATSPLSIDAYENYEREMLLMPATQQDADSEAKVEARYIAVGFHRAMADALLITVERFNRLDWRAWENERF